MSKGFTLQMKAISGRNVIKESFYPSKRGDKKIEGPCQRYLAWAKSGKKLD